MEFPSNAELIKELCETNLIKALSEKELAPLKGNIKFIHYRKGETIFKQGHTITELTILMRGLTKSSIENKQHDRSTIISLQLPLSMVGASTIFDEVYPATAVALKDSIVAFIDKNLVKQTMLVNAKFTTEIVTIISQCMNRFLRQIADLGQKQIRARMASVILIIADLIGKNCVDIQISRNELAEYAGVSTGSAIRLLSDLEKEGYIKLVKKTIEILDRPGLEKVSEQR